MAFFAISDPILFSGIFAANSKLDLAVNGFETLFLF